MDGNIFKSYTPGWNDPPSEKILNETDSVNLSRGSRLQERKNRRLVDPSILSGGASINAFPSTPSMIQHLNSPYANDNGNEAHLPVPSNIMPESQGSPRISHGSSTMSAYSTPSFHISHSSPHLTTLVRESPEKITLQTISADFQAMNMGGFGNRDHTHPHLQHHQPHSALDNGSKVPPPVSDGLTHKFDITMGMNFVSSAPPVSLPSPQQPFNAGNPQIFVGTNEAPFRAIIDHSQSQPSFSDTILPQQMNTKFFEPSEAPSIIFSPPNAIQSWPEQRPPTQPDPNNYRPPIKAAGDVSLSGRQLVAFLTKATLRLQQGTTREGIQLRIGQFDELIQMGQVSDAFQKRLNFVVDSIDREVYDEAWQFFEQMHESFPTEMASSWGHGIYILIQELRKLVPSFAPPINTRFM